MSQPSYSCPVASNVLTGSVTLLRTTPEDEDCLYLKVTAPLAYEKDQDLDTTLNTTISAKRLQKKKIDKFAYTVKKDDDTKSLIKARWFIKKDGKFTYPLAQVHPTVKLSYRTGLRECIKRADISDERRTKVMKMLDKNPDKFKQAFKDYMKSKEIDCLQAKVKNIQEEVEELKRTRNDMDEFVEGIHKTCDEKYCKEN